VSFDAVDVMIRQGQRERGSKADIQIIFLSLRSNFITFLAVKYGDLSVK